MRRTRLFPCLILAGGLALAAGCKPNLRVDHMHVHHIGGPNYGVHVVVENEGSGDAKKPFRVLFRNQTTGSPPKFVDFSHGLKHKTKRPIKEQLTASTNDVIVVRLDVDDNVHESRESDNVRKKPAP